MDRENLPDSPEKTLNQAVEDHFRTVAAISTTRRMIQLSSEQIHNSETFAAKISELIKQ